MKIHEKIKQYKLNSDRTVYYIIMVWVLMIAIVNPFGEFPLNDDWAYYKDVYSLSIEGHLKFVDWSAMTLISQILLGSLFCKIFGFSFTLLRCLTLFVGLIGVLTTFKILKELNINKQLILLCSLLLVTNPLFFSLSNTFMTDVYFFAFSMLAILFFNRSFNSNYIYNLCMGTLFAIIATLVRQIGVVIPVSYALVYVFASRPFNKFYLIRSSIAPICVMLSLYFFNYYVSTSNKGSNSYFSIRNVFSSLEIETFERLFNRLGTSGMTLGLFLFPLLILLFPNFLNNIRKKESWPSLLCTLILIIPLIHAWTMIPLGNIFYNFGLGPKLLKDVYILQTNNTPVLNELTWDFIRAICLIGGILLYYQVFSFIFQLRKQMQNSASQGIPKTKLFSLFILIFLFIIIVIPLFFFDRYLIQLITPLIIVILPATIENGFKIKHTIAAYAIIFLFMVIGSCLTHDYLAWNRARWQGLNYLTNDLKKLPKEVDGGFEFNGWNKTITTSINQDDKSWWFVDKDDYIVTFGTLKGHTLLKKFPYTQYFPYEEKNIYVLYKNK